MEERILYHTGFEVIRNIDLARGRKNADFGQGFYLTEDLAFSERWARSRKGSDTVINTYRLSLEGLKVLSLERDEEWFSYIFENRSGRDARPDYDVVTGPIANDTIYDVMGITTSGFLTRDQALALLRIGPLYRQTAVKTRKALSRLTFESARVLPGKRILAMRALVRQEEAAYQALFGEAMQELLGDAEQTLRQEGSKGDEDA